MTISLILNNRFLLAIPKVKTCDIRGDSSDREARLSIYTQADIKPLNYSQRLSHQSKEESWHQTNLWACEVCYPWGRRRCEPTRVVVIHIDWDVWTHASYLERIRRVSDDGEVHTHRCESHKSEPTPPDFLDFHLVPDWKWTSPVPMVSHGNVRYIFQPQG